MWYILHFSVSTVVHFWWLIASERMNFIFQCHSLKFFCHFPLVNKSNFWHMVLILTFQSFPSHTLPKCTFHVLFRKSDKHNIKFRIKKYPYYSHTPKLLTMSAKFEKKNCSFYEKKIFTNELFNLRLNRFWKRPAFHRCLIFHVFNLFFKRFTIHIC